MRINELKSTIEKFTPASTVWVGRGGCAVHLGANAPACIPCTRTEAALIIKKFGLRNLSTHADGILYEAI